MRARYPDCARFARNRCEAGHPRSTSIMGGTVLLGKIIMPPVPRSAHLAEQGRDGCHNPSIETACHPGAPRSTPSPWCTNRRVPWPSPPSPCYTNRTSHHGGRRHVGSRLRWSAIVSMDGKRLTGPLPHGRGSDCSTPRPWLAVSGGARWSGVDSGKRPVLAHACQAVSSSGKSYALPHSGQVCGDGKPRSE